MTEQEVFNYVESIVSKVDRDTLSKGLSTPEAADVFQALAEAAGERARQLRREG